MRHHLVGLAALSVLIVGASACAPSVRAFDGINVIIDGRDGTRTLTVAFLGDASQCASLDTNVTATTPRHTLHIEDAGHRTAIAPGGRFGYTGGDCTVPVMSTPLDEGDAGNGSVHIVDGDATIDVEVAHLFDTAVTISFGTLVVPAGGSVRLDAPKPVQNLVLLDTPGAGEVTVDGESVVLGPLYGVDGYTIKASADDVVTKCEGIKSCEAQNNFTVTWTGRVNASQ